MEPSPVLKFFSTKNNCTKASCRLCGKEIERTQTYSTSGLINHLEQYHKFHRTKWPNINCFEEEQNRFTYNFSRNKDGFRICNSTKNNIWVFITKYSIENGSDEWFMIRPGCSDLWKRSGFEAVVVRFSEDFHDRKGI